MPSLETLQRSMFRAILSGEYGPAEELIVPAGLEPSQRLALYANNAFSAFHEAMKVSFPAVARLTGEDYFRQSVRRYWRVNPSRSGDLQAVGERFPHYLAEVHGHDEYRYLSDVARLEWLREESLTAADPPPFDWSTLAERSVEDYPRLRFMLHPSVRLMQSEFPVLTIWNANTSDDESHAAIDLGRGGERMLLARYPQGFDARPLSAPDFGFLAAIQQGVSISDAIARSLAIDERFDAATALQRCMSDAIIVGYGSDAPFQDRA